MSTKEGVLSINCSFASEADAKDQTGLSGWTEVLMRGYGFEGDVDFANAQFTLEFGDDPDAKITVVHEGNKIVASLVLHKKPGFGDEIKAFNMHGIAIMPEYKRRGLGSLLYETAIRENGAQVLVGSSKNPAAAAARARAAFKCDMRTFLGSYEITSETECGPSSDHLSLLEVYLGSKSTASDPVTFISHTTPDILMSDVPKVEGFAPCIQDAFAPLIHAQREFGDVKTATLPLLSIRRDLLK
ncbi:MAG: GNAT family N-acetyltransferase [Candidatus Roizmanbacteria bacterium]